MFACSTPLHNFRYGIWSWLANPYRNVAVTKLFSSSWANLPLSTFGFNAGTQWRIVDQTHKSFLWDLGRTELAKIQRLAIPAIGVVTDDDEIFRYASYLSLDAGSYGSKDLLRGITFLDELAEKYNGHYVDRRNSSEFFMTFVSPNLVQVRDYKYHFILMSEFLNKKFDGKAVICGTKRLKPI